MRIAIVGSGAAGATAAQFARKTNRAAHVTLVSREAYGEYSKCGMPYVLGGAIDSFDKLIEYPPAWFERFGVNLMAGSVAREIDASSRTLVVTDATAGQQTIPYDTLILATGAQTRVPPIPGAFGANGARINGVHTLRTLDDARDIARSMDRSTRYLIVGAGLIGMELAEAMLQHVENPDLHVEVVDIAEQVLAGMLDPDIARAARDAAAEHAVRFMLGSTVVGIGGGGEYRVTVRTGAGDRSDCTADAVIIATGTAPDVQLAESAGCALGPCGGILVDSRCRTSIDGILAAGDCTEYPDLVTGRSSPVGLGSVAARQGRVAGINAAGDDEQMAEGLLNSRTTRLFGLELAAVGPTHAQLQMSGVEPIVGKFKGSTLPAYVPGGTSVTVKVLAHPVDGRILGAQLVGTNGTHLRADLFAAAILNGMTIREFVRLETCYAPVVAPTFDSTTHAAEAACIRWKRRLT